jgi:glycosyltransferase involved in cell wall biosynthesis
VSPVRVQVVDPSAFAPPYDHALCQGLANAGADVELITSEFRYGPVPDDDGYALHRSFYRLTPGAPGSRVRTAAKLATHVPDMLAWRRRARRADVVHLQWLPIEALDASLLPRGVPSVLTAHEVLPREPRPTQEWGRRRLYDRVDAVVAHTERGRERLTGELGLDPAKVEVIPHGTFDYLTRQAGEVPLPADLAAVEKPVVLHLGVWRPYHGIDVLLEAWRGIEDAELWIAGLPKMPVAPLRAAAPPGVRFLPRFVTDPELPAFFRRADIVVMPYRAIEASGVLFSVLPFGRAIVASDVGAFSDVAARGAAAVVPPEDPAALHDVLAGLLADPAARDRLGAAAGALSAGEYSWDAIGRRTLALYERLVGS